MMRRPQPARYCQLMDPIERWRRTLAADTQPRLLALGGIPATQKTSTAHLLGLRLRVPTVGCDELRVIMRLHDDNPLLHTTTHNVWKLLGDGTYSEQALLQGLHQQAEALAAAVRAVFAYNASRGHHTLVEGVHLLPELYPEAHWHAVLTADSRASERQRLREKFTTRPDIFNEQIDDDKLDQLFAVQRAVIADAQSVELLCLPCQTPARNALALAEDFNERNP